MLVSQFLRIVVCVCVRVCVRAYERGVGRGGRGEEKPLSLGSVWPESYLGRKVWWSQLVSEREERSIVEQKFQSYRKGYN